MILDFSNYSNVVYVGDLHMQVNKIKSFVENIKDSIIICTGDLELGKNKYESDVEACCNLEYTIAKNNNYFIIIRGNHDNPKYFKSKSSFRNELKEDAEHIILIPDYSIIHTHDNNILCIGGARTIDRVHKIKNRDYWQNENIQKPDDNFFSKLNNDNINIDIIVSHAAPLFAKPIEFSDELKYYNSYIMNSYSLYDKTVKNDVYKERLLLKGIYDKLNNKNHIKYWIFGHYHKSIETIYNKTKCISLNVRELKILENEK